ncbi:MAG: two-component regulator propeller domain-containing protein, partial [Bacteroidota bacterium]
LLPKKLNAGQFSLMSSAVRDATDPSGDTYFIGMWGSGIFKWNRRLNEKEHFHQGNSGLASNGIFCMMQDRRGFIWAGAYDVVSRLDPRTGKWRSWRIWAKRNNTNNAILSCIEDRQGGLWFGGNRSGLFRYNPATDQIEDVTLPPEAYTPNGRLYVYNMSLDRQGRIWLATRHHPVLFDPETGKTQVFKVEKGKEDYNLWESVVVAATGKLYVCSRECLLELDSACNVLRIFNTENGLRSRFPGKLVEDHLGRIWFTSTYLLHCFDPETGKFNYYGTADGLFKNTMTDALVKLPNGEIFVGFQDAFNYFDPVKMRRNGMPPPVAFTAFKVMDKERKPVMRSVRQFNRGFFSSKNQSRQLDSVLVLNPGENIFTIEFAALNFIQPERNRFAYRLEGFSDQWTETHLNFATYTNLD